MKTATIRKQEERDRKRQSGLVLKQVWVPPHFWPVIQDLTTKEAEAFVFGKSYLTKTTEEHRTAHVYELARELWSEIAEHAAIIELDTAQAKVFAQDVIRAMIKTMPHIDGE